MANYNEICGFRWGKSFTEYTTIEKKNTPWQIVPQQARYKSILSMQKFV